MRANRVDIARNLKIIEGLKVQLLSVIAELFPAVQGLRAVRCPQCSNCHPV